MTTTRTTTSLAAAAEPKSRAAIRLTPFTVRRHDMWAAGHAPVHRPTPIVRPHTPAQSIGSLLAPLGWLIAQPVGWVAQAWRMQGEIRDLNVLDDHLLRDMGLTRSEIRAALRKGAHPHPERPTEPGAHQHP